MADRKPKVEVVVEDELEKKAVADAAARAGYDNPGAYIRALLQREGVPLRQQQRGGWRGDNKEEEGNTLNPVATKREPIGERSGLLCIETANTLEHPSVH